MKTDDRTIGVPMYPNQNIGITPIPELVSIRWWWMLTKQDFTFEPYFVTPVEWDMGGG